MASSTATEPRSACLVCRQRKVACDRQRPRCGLCSRNDFDCQYKARQHRPGLRAGYVASLESQLSQVEERLRKVEAQLERGSPARSSSALQPLPDSVAPTPSLTPASQGILQEQPPSPMVLPTTSPGNTIVESPLISVPEESLFTLANSSLTTWFSKYHPWFPIIHEKSLGQISSSTSYRYSLVWKAILVVVVLGHNNVSSSERNLVEHVRDNVMLQGFSMLSVQSIQGLLILSNYYLVEGSQAQFWNILAICKKMSLHLHLHEVAATSPRTRTFSMQRTTGPTFNSVVEKEEAIRAFWMIETLDSISSLGSADLLTCLKVPSPLILPCVESIWASREPVIEHLPSARRDYLSPLALCTTLAMEELSVIRQFLEKPYDLTTLEQKLEWQTEAQRLDERLTNWREEFVAIVFRMINAERDHAPRGEMEPLITLVNCVLNMAILVLLQQMAPFPQEIERGYEPWAFATTRCVYACENLAAKVRRIRADQLDSQTPHLILPMFAAARFYIAYSKALDADVPVNLHTLAFTLHICGQHWPLAQQYETIIRAAVAEHRSPISQCVLPLEFYDLRYSTLEIISLLQETAQKLNL
ncbi:hypothetical protein V3481_014262 [Fusarium oxysporum f. sp. vasinfectum]|uniref:Zn(2)-C6 fungal-type domain-containing protein n=2 Tax=Fusarium oxysporum f. sp. vasinfectum 25433 TaxID=1089449 RepID=X0KYE9_FUSOX|nr:hypothetical protein FOTG_13207 [Fusarium oxysporum f. sp. vasinfectum 25433]